MKPCAEVADDLTQATVRANALELLTRHKKRSEIGAVHIDIGRAYRDCVENLRSALECAYVGIDIVSEPLPDTSLGAAEIHTIDLFESDQIFGALNAIIGERQVASISLLGGMEAAGVGGTILGALSRICRVHDALLALSASNVAHQDIGAKLLFGRWDYAEAKSPGMGEMPRYDKRFLASLIGNAGLNVVDRCDVIQSQSEQHFPKSHPALAASTSLNGLLLEVGAQANPASSVSRFVWLCAPTPRSSAEQIVAASADGQPFLSVIIRTQGRRLHTLIEVLTCIAGQTDTDFEVLVIGHRLEPDAVKALQRLLEDAPAWLRRKIRLIRVEDGNRTRPLNVGFEAALGEYIAILDDDDLPFGNWVETFHLLGQHHPGQILRAACVRQNVVNVRVNGRNGLCATGTLERAYPSSFEFLDHIVGNQSPVMSLAFPRGPFHDLGMRFDETLSTTEDWDFLLRNIALCGVAFSRVITSIYCWWADAESSRTVHSQEEWSKNYNTILAKQDGAWFILPKGETAKLRALLQRNYEIPLHFKGMLRHALRRRILVTRLKRLFLAITKRQRQRYAQRVRWYKQCLRQLAD